MSAQIIPFRKVAKPRARRPYRKPSPDRQRRRDDYYRAFAERLRFARAQLGISEQEAAAGFGVTVKTYRGYEAGKRQQTGDGGWVDFADTFGVSLNWFASCRDGEPPRFRLRAV
jgi:hypothetical protein